MKKYINPDIQMLHAEASTLLAGSLSRDGSEGNLTPSGQSGASGARSRRFEPKKKEEDEWEDEWECDSI